jgi:hypothetical protein
MSNSLSAFKRYVKDEQMDTKTVELTNSSEPEFINHDTDSAWCIWQAAWSLNLPDINTAIISFEKSICEQEPFSANPDLFLVRLSTPVELIPKYKHDFMNKMFNHWIAAVNANLNIMK